MKISRNVGAGVHGALPADVKLVQSALAAIKPLGKPNPHYKGSVDGRCGPLTISAISSFQSANHISATGRIEPISQTLRTLTEKTPKALQFMMERSGGQNSTGFVGSGNVAKVLEYGKIVSDYAKENWALPRKAAEDLSKSILLLSKDAFIPIMFNPPFPVSIDADGRFCLSLRLSEWGYEKSAEGLEEAHRMAETATEAIIKTGLWQRASGKALHIKTRDAMPVLANPAPINQQQLEMLGLESLPKDEVLAACCSALIHNPEAQVELTNFLQSMPKDIQDKQGKKLIANVRDGVVIQQTKTDDGLPVDHIFKPKEKEIRALVAQLNAASPTDFRGMAILIDEFWSTLKSLGDPIADLALELNAGEGWSAGIAAKNIRKHLGDAYFITHGPSSREYVILKLDAKTTIRLPNDEWRKQQAEMVEIEFRDIQRLVAIEHWKLASADRENIKGSLDPSKITDYHHDVLNGKGLPNSAFAGTIFGGSSDDWYNKLLTPVWCAKCDIAKKVE